VANEDLPRDTDSASRRGDWRRLERRLALSITAANVLGGVTVFVFLGLILPLPSDVRYDWGLLWRNLAVFVLASVFATVWANRRGRRVAAPVWRWYSAARAPTPDERAAALRQPVAQMQLSAAIWLSGVVIFTTFNAFASLRLSALIAFTIVLGGVSSCALTYLLAERFGRPVTEAALAGEAPETAVSPGVAVRILLMWGLTAGIPLVGGALLAIAVLTGADVSENQVAGSVLFLSFVGVTFGLFAMRLAARSIADPIDSVRRALGDVEAGDLEAGVPVYDGSEVGLLQAGFNRMVVGLRERERLRDLFGRHVGVDVARRALEHGVELEGEDRDCAAMFVDITGSTALAAARPATEVVALLNRFFSIVVEVVHDHEGWVNKFEGDAALCVFGVPAGEERAPTHALVASRQLCDRLRDEVPELRAAIGVSWGEAVAGNVGAAERYEYTVIGDPVNEAARLCELGKESEQALVVSEAVLSAADPSEASRWELGDSITLRGRAAATRLATPRA
jgi:adenylate cyclase